MTIPLLPGDPHDRALRGRVKPPGWTNPKPASRYQLVVLGGGPAGLVGAVGAAGLGARVALVERDLLGGDCLNVGCVPSKALLRAARAAAEMRRAAEFGVRATQVEIDFPAVMERVRRIRAELAPNDSAERLRSLGIDVFLGNGTFAGKDTVEVDGEQLRFGRCLVATGARPVLPDAPELKSLPLFTNETIFTLTELPRRLLVLGGGPVGCELGQAFARLGSKVCIRPSRHPGGKLLPREDEEARQHLVEAFRRDGIEVDGTGEFDAVLAAAGRTPNVEGLNLEAAGVKWHARSGITVDDYLRTSNPRIFAAGDVCSLGYMFSHAAEAMARLVVRNALFPGKGRASTLVIPSCTYTDPEIGSIGLSERYAIGRGIAVDVYRHAAPHLDRAVTDGAVHLVKVLVRKGTDRILGATVVGPHAGELVGTLSAAMTNGLGLGRLSATVFPYPTYTDSLKRIGDQFNRGRLTSRTKWLLGKWLRWFR
jgi:pyruvate/2-oxoglutarate dehydrogenase complex dihydrolipoamide dehydrogenase (E3) component